MKIIVERFLFQEGRTIGRLFIDGILKCYTIEDEVRLIKIKGKTAIPYGTYEVGTRYSPRFSPKFGHEMLWIKNVPDFEYILIHTGNTEYDTEGCLIVGSKIGTLNGQTAVIGSKTAYSIIYPIISNYLETGGKVTIEYTKH